MSDNYLVYTVEWSTQPDYHSGSRQCYLNEGLPQFLDDTGNIHYGKEWDFFGGHEIRQALFCVSKIRLLGLPITHKSSHTISIIFQ